MQRLLIVAGDFVKTGGMDRANYALAEEALNRGVQVELVAHRVAPSLLSTSGLTWHSVPKPFNSYWLGEPWLDRVGRQVGAEAIAAGGRALINGGNCQLPGVNWVHFVHAAFDFAPGTGPRSVKRRLERRQVLTRERRALQRAELVIANSDSTRREVLKHFDLDPARVRRVYLGIDPHRFAPIRADEAEAVRRELGVRGPFALFVGALGDRRKGFDVAFEAWRSLCRKPAWNVELLVAGSGPELERWRERAVECDLRDRVRFLGFRQDVSRIVAAASVLIAPARYEPYGLGVAEALASHVPAIVSGRAGIAELYPSSLVRFLLEDPESPSELAERVSAFFAAPAEAAASFEPLFAAVRARTWTAMASEMLDAMGLGYA